MIGHLLNRTPAQWRRADVADGRGGHTTSWSQVGTVAARFSDASPAERQAAAQQGVEISHIVYLLPDAAVVRGDRLVDGGMTIEITAVTVPSVASHHQKAWGKEEPWDEPTS